MSEWFKKPVNIVVSAVASAIAVAALILILWGVSHHTEGGLLEVCWVGGEALYVTGSERDNGTCTRPEELVWPQKQIPITVTTSTPAWGKMVERPDDTKVLIRAVDEINTQAGFQLFEMGSPESRPDAEIHFGGPIQAGDEEKTPPGYTIHVRVGDALRGHVYIRSDVSSSDRLLYLVLVHELLHIAGLEHDDFTSSLLFPITREEWNEEVMSTAYLSDHDKRLLQMLYKRNGRDGP